jgi:hypothetical protein
LDSQSTIDLVCNKGLVTEVFKSKKGMRLASNGGTMTVHHKAKVKGYHTHVWFSERVITNILALSNVIKQYRVTYDSNEKMFIVHRHSHGMPNMEFRMHKSGLHYYDPRDVEFTLINTVSENKEGFTKRQIKAAEAARTLYATLSYPSWRDFRWIIRSNQIKDCPVSVQDVDAAFEIWGKNVAALKGKTTRRKPIPVAEDFVRIPKEILNMHKDVALTADVFFVNKIPFFITLSRKICFTAVNHLPNRTVPEIFKAFKEIYQYYLHHGFRITVVLADEEFAPLQSLIASIPGGPILNLAATNEHVPEIERRIRVVKERCRATRHSLPFQRLPKLLTTHIVLNSIKLLNFFPTQGGISDTFSPKTILTGETLDFKKHLSLQIGQYCQVHEEDAPRNSQLPRTKGAISLGSSGNLQGGFKFIALSSGKKITRRTWDAIPIPDTVIARVNALVSDQPAHLHFTDRLGRHIGDLDERAHSGMDVNDSVSPTADTQIPGVDEDNTQIPGVDEGPGVDEDNTQIAGVDEDPQIPGVD